MYSTTAIYAMSLGNRLLITVSLLLFSAMLLAGQLITSINYDDLIKKEIYEDAGEWRQPDANEYQWRASAKEQDTGRIKFGSDPEFEQLQSGLGTNLDNSRYNTKNNLLRLEF